MLDRAILDTVQAVPEVLDYLSPSACLYVELRTRKAKGDGDLASINKAYNDRIVKALIDYFEGGGVAPSRNEFKRAMIQAFGDAFDLGYTNGGGELPIDDDSFAWLEARLNQEAGYIDMLFEQAKALRKEEEFDYFSWVTMHTSNYVGTLSAIYNAGSMSAKRNQSGTWELGNTEKHCKTCLSLAGKTHRMSWYLARNYIPRQPGSNLECGGWNCDCKIRGKDGTEITV